MFANNRKAVTPLEVLQIPNDQSWLCWLGRATKMKLQTWQHQHFWTALDQAPNGVSPQKTQNHYFPFPGTGRPKVRLCRSWIYWAKKSFQVCVFLKDRAGYHCTNCCRIWTINNGRNGTLLTVDFIKKLNMPAVWIYELFFNSCHSLAECFLEGRLNQKHFFTFLKPKARWLFFKLTFFSNFILFLRSLDFKCPKILWLTI